MKLQAIKLNKTLISVLSLFYLVGIIGFSIGFMYNTFVSLSPLLLFITFLLLMYTYFPLKKHIMGFILMVFLTGMITEIIGVNTGVIFGDYSYSAILSVRVYGVPVIIGLNWVTLCLGSMAIAEHFKINKWMKALISAFIMLGFDIIMEPIAVELGFWKWENHSAVLSAPWLNYISWLSIGFIINFLGYLLFNFQKNNNNATGVLLIMGIFFVSLNIAL